MPLRLQIPPVSAPSSSNSYSRVVPKRTLSSEHCECNLILFVLSDHGSLVECNIILFGLPDHGSLVECNIILFGLPDHGSLVECNIILFVLSDHGSLVECNIILFGLPDHGSLVETKDSVDEILEFLVSRLGKYVHPKYLEDSR